MTYNSIIQKGSFSMENQNFPSDFKIIWEFCSNLIGIKIVIGSFYSGMKFQIFNRKIVFSMGKYEFFFKGKYLT